MLDNRHEHTSEYTWQVVRNEKVERLTAPVFIDVFPDDWRIKSTLAIYDEATEL